jgi:hypothetical protein
MSAQPQAKSLSPHAAKFDAVQSDPITALVARLECVRKSGRGWTARCPAHEDLTASLSITSGDDGRVLIHCFAGCRAADVVAASGMELRDLFVRRPSAEMTFADRARLREYARQAQWRAALNVIAIESKIILFAGRELLTEKPLSRDDCERLAKACALIDGAQEVLCVQST